MIDFRYHLVSVIAIFMALAVGIVLGAGPLKDDIGTTLTAEVTKLREDKADLNAQLVAARREAAAGEGYAAATRRTVVGERLAGKKVAVVVAPGADEKVVNGVEATLAEAGATVTATARLADAWTHPDAPEGLAPATDALARRLGVGEVPQGRRPGAVLGRALLSSAERRGADPAAAREALQTLVREGLVAARPDSAAQATLAVTVAAPMTREGAQPTTPQVQAYADLVQALDESGDGSVLVSPRRPTDATAPLSAAAVLAGVQGVRPAGNVVSTVDDADGAAGQAATVLALVTEQRGTVGRYGSGQGAEAVLPELVTP